MKTFLDYIPYLIIANWSFYILFILVKSTFLTVSQKVTNSATLIAFSFLSLVLIGFIPDLYRTAEQYVWTSWTQNILLGFTVVLLCYVLIRQLGLLLKAKGSINEEISE